MVKGASVNWPFILRQAFDRAHARSQDERKNVEILQEKPLMVSQFILSLPKGTMR